MDAEDPPGADSASGEADTSQADTAEGDGTDQPTVGDAGADRVADRDGADSPDPRREVLVPMSLYKTVTVFSTLIAVLLVVGGMVALDVATGRATLTPEEISLPLAAAGVGAIVLGAAVYAFSTRFRAEGMGNRKEDTDEHSDDG